MTAPTTPAPWILPPLERAVHFKWNDLDLTVCSKTGQIMLGIDAINSLGAREEAIVVLSDDQWRALVELINKANDALAVRAPFSSRLPEPPKTAK